MLRVALERDTLEVVAVAGIMGCAQSRRCRKRVAFCYPTRTCRSRVMVFTVVSAMRHSHPPECFCGEAAKKGDGPSGQAPAPLKVLPFWSDHRRLARV
jgi:hypothetical protein